MRFFNQEEVKKRFKRGKKVAKFAFASVVSTKFIRKGQKLNINNIWVKRPGTGHFKAKDYHKLLGKKFQKNIQINTQIKKNDI